MEARDVLLAIVTLMAGGALWGGVVAVRKAGAEKQTEERRGDQIVVETAELLIGLSRAEIERLDKANERLEVRLAELEHETNKRIAALEAERDRLEAELMEEREAKRTLQVVNAQLQRRVRDLEREVESLKGGVHDG